MLTQEQKLAPPHCAKCSGMIRPGVVWFGENLPEYELSQAYAAAQQCDVLLSVGTSGSVYPIAQLPEIAAQHQATVIHVNPQSITPRSKQEYCLTGKAGEILPALLEQFTTEQ